MIKNLVFIWAIALLSTAHAQSSVTLYGRLDAGLLYANQNGGPGAGGAVKKNLFVFNSGGTDANIFGMIGQEDMGGDATVGFRLEGQFSIGTGALASSGTLFSRNAYIYIQNKYGRLAAGEQTDPGYLAMGKADPRDLANAFSTAPYWNFLEGKTVAPSSTVYEQNSLSYAYKTNVWSAAVLYRLGGQPGSLTQGRTISSGLIFDNGSVIATGYFLTKNDTKGVRDLRILGVGAGYRIGDFTFRGNYTDYQLPQGNDVVVFSPTLPSHIIVADAGMNWQVNPFNRATLAYYFAEDKMNTRNATGSYVLSDDYSLSKRTKLYGFVGYSLAKKSANGLTNLLTSALTSAYPGGNTTSVGIGLETKF